MAVYKVNVAGGVPAGNFDDFERALVALLSDKVRASCSVASLSRYT